MAGFCGGCKRRLGFVVLEILLLFLYLEIGAATYIKEHHWHDSGRENENIISHSCIHDQILEQRKKPGHKVYSVTPQVYQDSSIPKPLYWRGRALLGLSNLSIKQREAKHPIRIYLNYDAVGHSYDRDCRNIGDAVKLGEPSSNSVPSSPSCNAHGDPPVFSDCWYNCTLEDISGEDKQQRLRKALGQTVDWFGRALAVEPVKGNLRLSGYSACGQDGGVQLPREYVEEGIANADLVLLVTTRPTAGNTLAWAVACERDQWGRAIAGHVNVAPRHLTAEAETLLSATLIHEVMHVLGFDPHAFSHFRDERKRRRSQVTEQVMDERLGRMVTRVVLPRVVMHSRSHYGAFSDNLTGLELEDGGGRGTSGSHWEKRLLMNEIMTGSVDTRSVVSKMTLALLEDSGWYEANYSMADHLDWGRNQGIEFVTSPCNLWKGAYHCNASQFSGCTYNREAEGYCPIVSYSGDLPKWAQYFPQTNKGGQSSLADYCTYFVAYSDGSCTDANSARPPDRMLGEVRGSSSRCMTSSLVRAGFVRGSMTQGNGCYQHRCVNRILEVAVDGIWKACPEMGGPVQFPSFNGELICPAYLELCNTGPIPASGQCPKSCSFNGDCVDGECRCFLGFYGHDCSERSCPGNCGDHGQCLANGMCLCDDRYTGVDCSTKVCDEQCSIHGGVCDNGKCEFRCSDYAGYTCRNSSALLYTLSVCQDVLETGHSGQHCAPSEPSVLQQLEEVVVMPNYHRLFPGGARKLINSLFHKQFDCDAAAKKLACWISIQKCDRDGDNRLRVCHSACQSYNKACGASLDCSDLTLFSGENERGNQCTGSDETIRYRGLVSPGKSSRSLDAIKQMLVMMASGFGESTSGPPQSPRCSSSNNSEASSFECNICFDLAQDPIVTLCGRWTCLYKWLHIHSQSQECPVCKALVEEEKLVPLYGHGKTSTDPRSKSIPGVNIPNRPAGQRPETAPPPEPHHYHPQHGFEFMDGLGWIAPMATSRFGNFISSAAFGGLFPSLFNFQVHGFPNAAVYGPTGLSYGFHNTFHGVGSSRV